MPDQSGQAVDQRVRRDALAVFMLLAGASVICVALVFARMAHSGTSQYRFMLWNLALAWVPVLLATAIFRLATRDSGVSWGLLVPAAWSGCCSSRTRRTC